MMMMPLTKRSCNKLQKSMGDRISALPDEILVYILSLLTLREAAMTSILSSRWRNLWTFVFKLDFDVADKKGLERNEKKPRQRRRLGFVKWVNGILRLHQSETIDEFRVYYDLDNKAARHIDAWISFALAKKVRNLDLNLSGEWVPGSSSRFYTFPCSLFAGERASSVEYLVLRACILCPPPGFGYFKSLVTLSLQDVDVTQDLIDNFLSHCSLLEHLCVQDSENLVSLKVKGGSLRLKDLEVYYCSNLQNIEIYATNLVSFKYRGPKISLNLKCGPPLVDIYCGVFYATCKDRMPYVVSQLQSCIFQLKTLTLELTPVEVSISSKILPTFSNLKVLVLLVAANRESLTVFASLLKVSPVLHRFELHLMWRKPCINPREIKCVSECVSECAHQCLKEVEVSGFRGHAEDMELAMYLLNNAVTLDKFTIDPYDRSLCGNVWFREKDGGIIAARECAKKLLMKKPPNVLMSIL